MLSGKMSKNKKILFSGIFLAAVAAILLFAPTKTTHAFMDEFTSPVSTFLYVIFLGCAQLLKIAGLLFDYAVNPDSFTDVITMEAVLNGWKMVRDLFNIAFILVLLFSAFSTIFAVESFHIGKIWLRLVIIALLVNFSYPIALFIIDASNVLMYYFLNAAFSDGGSAAISTGWAKWTGVTDALVPRDSGGGLNYGSDDLKMKLVMAIVVVFVLMATMITMAILLVIRIVVLAILVILAPAGFVAGILPSTKKHSDDWWSNLFKYSFMGPTLAFTIVLGMKMMMEMKNSETIASINKMAASSSSSESDPSYLASLTFYIIPIVLMWSGMIVAQKLGVAGAGLAVKVGQGAAKKFSGFNAVKKRYDAFSAERKERADAKFKKGNLGKTLGGKVNDIQDKYLMAGAVNKKGDAAKRHDKRKDAKNKEDIKNASENYNVKTEKELHDDIQKTRSTPLKDVSDSDIKEAAGKVQQLQSRGAAHERELEKDIKSTGYAHRTAPKPAAYTARITRGMNAAQVAMEQEREKKAKKDMDDWVRNEKEAIIAEERAIVKEAEDRGKINKRP